MSEVWTYLQFWSTQVYFFFKTSILGYKAGIYPKEFSKKLYENIVDTIRSHNSICRQDIILLESVSICKRVESFSVTWLQYWPASFAELLRNKIVFLSNSPSCHRQEIDASNNALRSRTAMRALCFHLRGFRLIPRFFSGTPNPSLLHRETWIHSWLDII